MEVRVKAGKLNLFALGILPFLLAGCFSPTSVMAPKDDASTPDYAPFSVEIQVGVTGGTRSIAGPTAARITGDIRNMVQLMVIDSAGDIVAYDEVRRKNDTETDAVLVIDNIPFAEKYYFFLLMGHWERDYAAESLPGNAGYKYKENEPPTLLAAGFREEMIEGNKTVTVTMWPIVVDTKFTTADNNVPVISRTAEAVVTAGKPGKVSLLPVEWGVSWTIRQGTSPTGGLAALFEAQKILTPLNTTSLLLKSQKTVLRAEGLPESISTYTPAVTNDVNQPIFLNLDNYTNGITRINTEGSVNFRLEYIPYNNTDAGKWQRYDEKSVFDLSGEDGKLPVWIIRNGVNDAAQNTNTDFNNLGKTGHSTANGNGAVSFTIAEVTSGGGGGGEQLIIKDGKFSGPKDSSTPKIKFTTEGYADVAEVYYAVVSADGAEPGFGEYIPLVPPSVPVGLDHEGTVTLPGPASNGYDIYVRLFKGGIVSPWIKIKTKGNPNINWIWGESLVIENGRFLGPKNSDEPEIAFTTKDYDGLAEVLYAVVTSDAPVPVQADYDQSLGLVPVGDYTKTVTLPGPAEDGYDIYVLLLKDNEVCNPIRIKTKGSPGLDWEWGD
jgi:hypothetical protein